MQEAVHSAAAGPWQDASDLLIGTAPACWHAWVQARLLRGKAVGTAAEQKQGLLLASPQDTRARTKASAKGTTGHH